MKTKTKLKRRSMAAAFNEWMRLYTDEPERFAREFQTVGDYLTEKGAGKTPSYGKTSAAYLRRLMGQG